MGFSDNIFNFTGGLCPSSFRITVCGDNGVYVEGAIKIMDIKPQIVIIKVKNGKIVIKGNNLKLKSYFQSDLSIIGEIKEILREKDLWKEGF